jgi:Flp pilus assembly protein TadB
MKKGLAVLLIAALASCTTNKYAAHFRHYNKQENYATEKILDSPSSLQPIQPEALTASLQTLPTIQVEQNHQTEKKEFNNLTKQQRKQVKIEIKKEIKRLIKQKSADDAKVINASGSWDQDLKMAAIFGVVGIVAVIIGTTLFNIIGAIALIIGAVFLVKWIMRQ